MIHIRPATPDDALAISVLGNAVKRHGEKPSRHWESQGFLTYPKSAHKWHALLAHPGGFGHVAEDDTGTMLGYLVSYDPALTQEEHGGPKTALQGFYQALVANMDDQTIYLEQIARHPEHRGQGIAHKLYEQFNKEYPQHKQLAGIVHAPVKNKASIRFFKESLGFSLVDEYQDEGEELAAGLYMKTPT